MRVFKLKDFSKRAARAEISEADLCEAVERAERGQIDAPIGKFLIKQRIARQNQDRAKGFRTIIVHKARNMAVFMHMFPKTRRANLTDHEERAFRLAAKQISELGEKPIEALVESGEWIEVKCDRHQANLH